MSHFLIFCWRKGKFHDGAWPLLPSQSKIEQSLGCWILGSHWNFQQSKLREWRSPSAQERGYIIWGDRGECQTYHPHPQSLYNVFSRVEFTLGVICFLREAWNSLRSLKDPTEGTEMKQQSKLRKSQNLTLSSDSFLLPHPRPFPPLT